jgi:hypothetical protein
MKFLSILIPAILAFSLSMQASVNPDGTYFVDPSDSVNASDKVFSEDVYKGKLFINEDELCMDENAFHIHVGGNVWLETSTIHRDILGLYTYENSIKTTSDGGYEKHWRCPYCNTYCPWGQPCTNPNCPSKFK